MRRVFVICMMMCLWSCSNEGATRPEILTPPEFYCDVESYCEGNIKFVCEAENGGTYSEVPCGTNETCVNGECVPNDRCDSSFVAHCRDKQAISCVDGWLHYEDCQISCEAGACLTQTCEDAPYPYCNEQGQRVSCHEGTLSVENCLEGSQCIHGECKPVAKACGNGTLDADEACDDGDNNGKYGQCRSNCSGISRCGDGILDAPNEICDDGENNGKPGQCLTTCQLAPGCGNGVIDDGEECDPPSTGMVVTCGLDCQKPKALFEEFPTAGKISTEVPNTCDPFDLWGKYLIYRERFIGNAAKHIPGFISWGTEPGQSLPAENRDALTDCATIWRYNHEGSDCDFADLPDAQGSYGWGDTSLWLGIMAHWLALEYYTYQLYGLDTSETEKYIYLTLKAFERLDIVAETYFGLEGKLDGFFIRDDIPRMFFKEGETYRFQRIDSYTGYECAVSTTACKVHSGATAQELLEGGAFVSQDQLTGLFEGFGMIAKWVPENVSYQGYGLRNGARGAIDRIVRHLKAHNWMLGIETSDGWLQIPGEWGGYAQLMSSLFAESANTIAAPDFGIADYHDEATQAIKGLIPNLISTLWGMWEYDNNYNRNLILRLMQFTNFWSDEKFNQTSLESGREFWPLAHALYWDRPLPDDYPLWRMHAILSTAPCEGPCTGDACAHPTAGWMGDNYFASPNLRLGYAHNSGEYNGLDYLVGYPLYLLAYTQKTGRSYTQMTHHISSEGHLLQDIIQGAALPKSYRVSENGADMPLMFCGRPFADWIRDNALGLTDIYTGTTRWQCTLAGECTLLADQTPYTHTNALIMGTNDKDIFNIPTKYHHCISSLGGDDEITVASGMHFIEGGDGNDTIHSNGPHVTIYGGRGDDIIMPGSGYHLVDGGDGNDIMDSSSQTGTYLYFGGDGDDTLRVGNGGHTLVGGRGNDILETGSGDNVIWGNEGHDKIKTGNGDNIIFPGDGHAFIRVGNGDNSIQTISPQNDTVYICFGTGKNSIYAGWSSTSYCSNIQNSDIHQNSCRPTLTEEDCALSQYEAWAGSFE